MSEEIKFFLPKEKKTGTTKEETNEMHSVDANNEEKIQQEKKEGGSSHEREIHRVYEDIDHIERDFSLTGDIIYLQFEGFQTLVDVYGIEKVFSCISNLYGIKNLDLTTVDIIRSLEPDKKKRLSLYEKIRSSAIEKGKEIYQKENGSEEEWNDYLEFSSDFGSGGNFSNGVEASVNGMIASENFFNRVFWPNRLLEYMGQFAQRIYFDENKELIQQAKAEDGDFFRVIQKRGVKRKADIEDVVSRTDELYREISESIRNLSAKKGSEKNDAVSRELADLRKDLQKTIDLIRVLKFKFRFEKKEGLFQNRSMLEMQPNEKEKVRFFDLDSFDDPLIERTLTEYEIPSSAKYILDRDRSGTSKTLQKTLEDPSWKQQLHSLLSSYFESKNPGTLEKTGIYYLDLLTPKQAIELATSIVVDLTKYDYESVRTEQENIRGGILDRNSRADELSVLDILREGLERKDDPSWTGNGLCRNFAACVKAVFETLKEYQLEASLLRNTYCTYEAHSSGTPDFRPKTELKWGSKWGLSPDDLVKSVGHAWNTFVSISKDGETNMTITDATWANRNLETGQIENLDHTKMRMESIVYDFSRNIENAANKEEQWREVLLYYASIIETPADSNAESMSLQKSEQNQFFTTRVVRLLGQMRPINVPDNLPEKFSESIGLEYSKMNGEEIEKDDMRVLHALSKKYPKICFENVLKKYLEQNGYSDSKRFLFGDDDLQKLVFETMKLRGNDEFEKLVGNSPDIRVRAREIFPKMFLGFFPQEKESDLRELSFLLDQSVNLRRYKIFPSGKEISKDVFDGTFQKIRESLRSINTDRYDELVSEMSDYEIVKQFDSLRKDLARKIE